MRKEVIIVIGFIVLISAGAFAQVASSSEISEEVTDYVKTFVEKGGIDQNQISDITEINQSSLPDEVEIKKIDENNVGIYEVNYTQNNQSKKLFIVTYSTNEFKKEEQKEIRNIQNLNFGLAGIATKSIYLDTVTGVKSGSDSGYVMMHSGSITGISTSIKTIDGNGKAVIKVFKNGKDTGFNNLILSTDKNKIDYDLQSENIITYNPGDVISVYVEISGSAKINDIVTMVETSS
jgi:hypothetical protein